MPRDEYAQIDFLSYQIQQGWITLEEFKQHIDRLLESSKVRRTVRDGCINSLFSPFFLVLNETCLIWYLSEN
ncbi:MAG TPA: hypothetical protein VMV49_18275 [Candidatus Deferrimicrobium sp.]|nr:hypothetical protein [Candidatus Deferrimicrobium sp.]